MSFFCRKKIHPDAFIASYKEFCLHMCGCRALNRPLLRNSSLPTLALRTTLTRPRLQYSVKLRHWKKPDVYHPALFYLKSCPFLETSNSASRSPQMIFSRFSAHTLIVAGDSVPHTYMCLLYLFTSNILSRAPQSLDSSA